VAEQGAHQRRYVWERMPAMGTTRSQNQRNSQIPKRAPGLELKTHGPSLQCTIPQREKVTKREDGFVCVNIHGKDVLVVAPTGEVQLNGGGDTGHDTFRAMNDSLNRFGFKLTKSQTDETQWTLGDGKRVLQRYEHGMIIPAPTPPGPGRGLALMQRDEPKPENGHFSGGFARGWSPGGRGFGRGRGRGRY
jgi:hypothetical protein